MGRVEKIEFPRDPQDFINGAAVDEAPGWESHLHMVYDVLYVEARGFPADAISEAHRIGQFVLGENPWHVVHIELESPMARGLGKKADDCWLARVWMQRK